jgi:cytosine/adenosine deaminase-related metal-dependent hydrolase
MLLVTGSHVWTGRELLSDAAVLCEGGRIRALGDRAGLLAAWPGVRQAGGPGMVVLPGLINAHHHGNGVTSFQRGVADDALEPWLAALRFAPAVDPYLDTLWAALGLLEGGYSTVGLFQSTADPEAAWLEATARIQACLDAGIRVAFGLDLVQQNFHVYGPDPAGLPPRSGLSTGAYLELLEELRNEYAGEPRVSIFAAPSGPQWVSDEAWEQIGAWTLENGVPLHTHCLESPLETEYARREYEGGSAVRHLDRLGALHQFTSLVHGVYLTVDELQLLRQRGASLITNPGSNLRLRCGVSPVLAALEQGVNVALGTDGCTLGERDDAFREMRLLLNLQRTPGMDSPALGWQQALHTATGAAAAVLPWGADLGVLEADGPADLSVFDLEAAALPWSHPALSPLQLLVQRASSRHVAAVVVDGRVVFDAENGPLKVNSEQVVAALHDDLSGRTLPVRNETQLEQVREFYRNW